MIRTVEAVINAHGRVQLLEPVALEGDHRALVTIIEEAPATHPDETAVLSKAALADWDRKKEDAAWSHLQLAQ
ncbi:MAG: hypothetical protein M3461_23485 [Pseudomonadota bacterium]|nr:hypothetical protein [Pseudomonadota bacterium]